MVAGAGRPLHDFSDPPTNFGKSNICMSRPTLLAKCSTNREIKVDEGAGGHGALITSSWRIGSVSDELVSITVESLINR